METIRQFFLDNAAIAVFAVLCVGYLIGKLKYKMLALGTVTSVLLVGVVMGIWLPDIKVLPPLKTVFFLLFLFSIGYSVGPQFFRSFKKTGLPQVLFAIVLCLICLVVTWACAKIAGYNAGEAVGLFSGAQTISAVIGVGQETIAGLHISPEMKQSMQNVVPVMYAVTYVFGTAGSAWVLAFLGPRMLGGMKKCREDCMALEAEMGSTLSDQPGYASSMREVTFRCYTVKNDWFGTAGRTVAEIEAYALEQGHRLFVDRVRHAGQMIDTPIATQKVYNGDEVVLSGRRELVVGEETWIGPETVDEQLLTFAVRNQPVLATKRHAAGLTVKQLLEKPWMHGVCVSEIKRQQSIDVPVKENVLIESGDMLTLVGMPYDVATAAKQIGLSAKQTNATDIVFMTFGLLVGAVIGVLSFNAGNVPVSLTVSGGALVMGLVFGWWHSRRPDYGQMPPAATWLFRDLGLNVFIACVGLESGPHFIQGFEQVGPMIFVWGAVATTLPLLIGVWVAGYLFKFRPATALGAVAGARTTTAALGAMEETLHSSAPAVGYAITYAVGNTVLILLGVVMVILCQ